MSQRFTLNKQDLLKVGKGALIAGSGALLTYLLGQLPNVDFGQYTPIIVSVLSIAINAALKFIEGQKTPVVVTPLRDEEIE
jgi:hypothetical protein